MTAPPRMVHRITDAGHHLALVGANGETILTSEVYTGTSEVTRAVDLVRAWASSGDRWRLTVEDTRTRIAPRIDPGPGHAADVHHNPGVAP